MIWDALCCEGKRRVLIRKVSARSRLEHMIIRRQLKSEWE
jgi:hypothetical protein